MKGSCARQLLLLVSIPLLLVAGAREAGAHALGVSRGIYRPTPEGLAAELTFDAGELSHAERAPHLERRIVQNLHVASLGQPCEGALRRVRATEPSGLTLDIDYRCAAPGEGFEIRLGFWDELESGHRHFASAPEGAFVSQAVSFAGAPSFELSAPRSTPELERSAGNGLLGWIRYGVEHILGGYDHLLFLAALVLLVRDFRALAQTVSIFTLAHSTTLALSACRIWVVPAEVVEPLIALSISYVAIENLTSRALRPRRLVVFTFGLIHGFGFAGALSDLGLGSQDRASALIAFNLGVEIGQLALLSAAYPVVAWLRRHAFWRPRAVPAVSAAIALMGALWFTERLYEAARESRRGPTCGPPLCGCGVPTNGGDHGVWPTCLSSRDDRGVSPAAQHLGTDDAVQLSFTGAHAHAHANFKAGCWAPYCAQRSV